MSIPPETFLALTLAILVYPISTGSHHGSSQRHLQKRLAEVFHRFSPLVTSHATLNHGQDCVSPYEEKLRQQIVENLHLIATSHATVGQIKETIKKMEEFISMNDKELCNYLLALVCDPDTRKCVCGPSRVNVTFVWEEGKCRYSEGSMCSHSSKLECARETRCISMTTLEECTSGLCFCQREYFPPTTTVSPITTTVMTSKEGSSSIEDFEDGEDGDDDEEENGMDENENSVSSPDLGSGGDTGNQVPVTSTKESFISRSSEDGDDDDDGDGEKEKIIEVKFNEVEKAVEVENNNPTESKSPKRGEEEEVDENLPTSVREITTIPSPIAASPLPTRRQELTSAIRRLEREVESIQTLRFGDECFSISEESNYAEYRRLVSDMDCVTGENDEENLTQILGKLEQVLESGSMMCNWTLHLQCNGQSKKCQCRTSSEDLDGFYLLFMEEGRKCVLVENSRCLSKEYLISRKSPFTNIPCAKDTKCVAEETKAECKSKIENCFCRKPPSAKTTETPKKKSRTRGKGTSAANSIFERIRRVNFNVVVFVCMVGFTMLLPRIV